LLGPFNSSVVTVSVNSVPGISAMMETIELVFWQG
jgi:hypothetical protein